MKQILYRNMKYVIRLVSSVAFGDGIESKAREGKLKKKRCMLLKRGK